MASRCFTGCTEERKGVTHSNAQLAVAWPSSVTGFQLQQNTNLDMNNCSNVTDPVVLRNGMNEIIVSLTNPANFYRLINQ
jgi:hypothetical protein